MCSLITYMDFDPLITYMDFDHSTYGYGIGQILVPSPLGAKGKQRC